MSVPQRLRISLHSPALKGLRARHPTDPRIVYLGTAAGVNKSADGGLTWQWPRNGFPPTSETEYTAPIGAMVMDPHDPKASSAGVGRPRFGDCRRGTIYRTTDGGDYSLAVNRGGQLRYHMATPTRDSAPSVR